MPGHREAALRTAKFSARYLLEKIDSASALPPLNRLVKQRVTFMPGDDAFASAFGYNN